MLEIWELITGRKRHKIVKDGLLAEVQGCSATDE
jgi:hypothetical protein